MTEEQRALRDLRNDIIDTTAEHLSARGITVTETVLSAIRAELDKMPRLVGLRIHKPRARRRHA